MKIIGFLIMFLSGAIAGLCEPIYLSTTATLLAAMGIVITLLPHIFDKN